MKEPLNITVIGDFDASYAPHVATNNAISHSAKLLGLQANVTWLATEALETDLRPVKAADALWCAPGSPFRSLRGEACVLELPGHPYYIATLFVPQNRSTVGEPHPLVTRLLSEAADRATESRPTP